MNRIPFSSKYIEPTFVDLQFDIYVRGGATSLQLLDSDSREHLITVSVNVAQPTPVDCLWIKDYSENEGVIEGLHLAGIITGHAIKTIATGFVSIPLYRLTQQALEECARQFRAQEKAR